MAIFRVMFTWRQEVREQVYQDESRHVGYRKANSVAYIVAPSEKLARASLDYKDQEILGVEKIPLYGIVSASGMARVITTEG